MLLWAKQPSPPHLPKKENYFVRKFMICLFIDYLNSAYGQCSLFLSRLLFSTWGRMRKFRPLPEPWENTYGKYNLDLIPCSSDTLVYQQGFLFYINHINTYMTSAYKKRQFYSKINLINLPSINRNTILKSGLQGCRRNAVFVFIV